MARNRPCMLARRLLGVTLLALSSGIATASSLLPDGGLETMKIDILPGNPDNRIDLGKQRKVAVAIYGSAQQTHEG